MSWEREQATEVGLNSPGFWDSGDVLVQFPAACPQRERSCSLFPHPQVIVFGKIYWACKLNCSKPRSAQPWMQGGEIPLAPGSVRSAAEQRCPGAAGSWLAARAVLSCCFLLMQQKAFPSSLYPSNRQDPIRLVMRQNKNTRHKAEAQMLAFMVSFIPSVAQGSMASHNFPQHIFLAVPI